MLKLFQLFPLLILSSKIKAYPKHGGGGVGGMHSHTFFFVTHVQCTFPINAKHQPTLSSSCGGTS